MKLSTTYFGPVQWYSKLRHCMGQSVEIEACESFLKQTYRNRCVIATANGQQSLTIPVIHGDSNLISDTLISDHGNWRHLHWQALQTAYGESAFFEYYADDIHPFYEKRWERLLDYNMDAARLMCRLLDIDVELVLTEEYVAAGESPMAKDDFRNAIRPKNPPVDEAFTPRNYYQVYRERHGFMPNLSILDLLFNEGPQAILFL